MLRNARSQLRGALLLVALAAFWAAPAAADDVIVVDSNAFGGSGGVVRVDAQTGARTTLSENTSPPGIPAFVNPGGVSVAANGDLLLADVSAFPGGGVIRVNPQTGARTTVSANGSPAGTTDFGNAADVALAANGGILVADADSGGSSSGVIRVDPTTGARTLVSKNGSPTGAPSFDNVAGIAVSPNGDILAADGGGRIIGVDPANGTRTTISDNATPPGAPNFLAPQDLAVDATGAILVVDVNAFPDTGGGVIRVDPKTGARSTVSQNAAPIGGPSFVSPVRIAVAGNGDLLVLDQDAFDGGGGVIRVNPKTGVRTTVSENATPLGGPSFVDPAGIALGFDFTGFFAPVDNLPLVNPVKAGAAVPVKFGLNGAQGLDVFAAQYPKSQQIVCSSTAVVDGIESTVTAGSSSLSHDATAEQYTYVWKTVKAWAGTCRQLVVRFTDGTTQRANFRFR